MGLPEITQEDELIDILDRTIADLQLKRADLVARIAIGVVRCRPKENKIIHNGREWDFNTCTSRKIKKKRG